MPLALVQRCNPVLALYLALAMGAAWGLPFLRLAPNRLLTGEAVYLRDVLLQHGGQGNWALLLALVVALAVWLCMAMAWPKNRVIQTGVVLAMAWCLAGAWSLAGHFASSATPADNVYARTALGSGFWTLCALAWLAALDAIHRLHLSNLRRLLLQGALWLPLLLSLNEGQHLSIAKEYANHRDVLVPALLRHLHIVLLAVVPALGLGLLLAWRMTKTPPLRTAVFPVLNVIQTIPSIAVFGLLMGPLAWLASQWPSLGRAGISGVGMAPAVLALLMYALLPIARSALAGLEQVPQDTVHAARAMGMSQRQVFLQVELPLAWPVLLLGLRTALVQTIGLTAVSALVGAGGLGQIMFDGLYSAANELVMLGVIPIVLLATLADTLFKVLGALTRTEK
jgi:osmoprotectant transport system permease protein